MEFLAPDNVCGQQLLTLVARASAIVCELLRLSDNVPGVFSGQDQREAAKYAEIIFDFKYIKNAEVYDLRIEEDERLFALDEEFRENYVELLERFFQMFEAIYKYYVDLKQWMDELCRGEFLQHTVEDILMNTDGKQLMTESVYMYGVMLLLLDLRLPGPVRERLITSYCRYKGSTASTNVDSVVRLCRTTGFTGNWERRPKSYPESYFGRFSFDPEIILMIVGRLRADDLYNLAGIAYPSPRHRSAALSDQASMLFVILYFRPDILHKKNAIMREIVDKHYSDNWIITFHMGHVVDLEEAWKEYKAARAALKNTLEKENVMELTQKYAAKVPELQRRLESLLVEGVLTDDYVQSKINHLLNDLREFNTTLRWLLLHRGTKNKKLIQAIQSAISQRTLLQLLLNLSQFEFILKETFKTILSRKEELWAEYKTQARERMEELGKYFSGELALTRVKKDENLQTWFTDLAQKIESLDYAHSTAAGRKIAHITQALLDVEEFHQVEASLQVKQFLHDTRDYLQKMIRIVNVRPELLTTISIVSDFSYAWVAIGEYVPLMHAHIKHDPGTVLKMRAVFLKLVSILDLPLVRISQCESKDVVSVAQYYSSQLVHFVRKVLQIIPVSMFGVLAEIVQLQTSYLKELPIKLERLDLKKYAQLDHRYTLARLTHRISVFTQGMLAMETTLVGVLQVVPKQLLEDGLRRELVQQITSALHRGLVFGRSKQTREFEQRIEAIGFQLDGFLKSFEYIQDYLNIYGLKIWQEEFTRIISFHVEQESNRFLKRKVYHWQSLHQSDTIPIPLFPPLPKDPAVNFMGRVVNELCRQTDPKRTTYVEAMQGWFDMTTTQKETVGIRTFDRLNRGLSPLGLAGVDRLICFMVVSKAQDFVAFYRGTVGPASPAGKYLTHFKSKLHPTSHLVPSASRFYQDPAVKLVKLWPRFTDSVLQIGQLQLIRRHLGNQLNFSSKLESKMLSSALSALNATLLNDIKAHYSNPEQHPYPDEDNELLPELSKYLNSSGFHNPLHQIYVTTEPLDNLPLLLFLLVSRLSSSLTWDSRIGALTRKTKKDELDGAPLVAGIVSILKQFHIQNTHQFLAYAGQYVRSIISKPSDVKGKKAVLDFPEGVRVILLFLEEFCRYAQLSRKMVEAYIPSYIFDRFRH